MREVVWIEMLQIGLQPMYEMLLTCGHKSTGACTVHETVCFVCPEIHIGDIGPLDNWTPYKTVRFHIKQNGGVV